MTRSILLAALLALAITACGKKEETTNVEVTPPAAAEAAPAAPAGDTNVTVTPPAEAAPADAAPMEAAPADAAK